MPVLAGSGLADEAGLDGLAKVLGRERCVGGGSCVGCQDRKVGYTFCYQGCHDWNVGLLDFASVGLFFWVVTSPTCQYL